MSFGVGIGDIVTVIQISKSICDTINGREECIQRAFECIEAVEGYVEVMQMSLSEGGGLAQVAPEARDKPLKVLEKIEQSIESINSVLSKWPKEDSKFRRLKELNFTFGSGPKDLESCRVVLRERLEDLDRYVGAVLTDKQGRFIVDQRNDTAVLVAANNREADAKAPSVPVAEPVSRGRQNLGILFVDPFNEGRSVIAQGYAELVREWTKRAQQPWRISRIHSAGIRVKSRDPEVVKFQDSMQRHLSAGGQSPVNAALDALFEDKRLKYPFKQKIKQSTQQHTSRGLEQDLFSRYDYVVVFTRKDERRMMMLKDALETNEDVGSGKIVLLGSYRKPEDPEIPHPPKISDDGDKYRAEWDTTVSELKRSFKAFLKAELDWIRPAGARGK